MDFSQYVGIPFVAEGRDRLGCDCYGILRLVYRERLGIELPIHTGYTDTLGPEAAALIDVGKADWRPVTEPQPFDAVLFRVLGQPHHIGLVIRPGVMLHSTRGKDSCIEDYRRPLWRARLEGTYRYAERCKIKGRLG